MRFILSLFLVLLVLTGCSSKKRVVSPVKTLPIWYTSPQISNTNTLYALGEGEDKNEAIANALSTMLATLSVSIESEFNTKSVVRDGSVSSMQTDSTNEIRTKVQKLRISDYQIIHAQEFGFQNFLAAIKSDKKKIFSSLNKEITQKIDIIQRKYEESLKYNLLKQLSLYKEAKDSTSSMKNILLVMNSLNPSFNDSRYLSQIFEIEKRYEDLLSQITFSITSNQDAKILRPSISNGLSLDKYKIVRKTNTQNHFNIFIKSVTSKARSYGFNLARSAISIVVKNHKGVVVGSNKLNITGQSTQGYAIAKENVAMKLNAKIIEDGIAKIIGLEL